MAVGRPKAKRKSYVVKTIAEVAEFFGVTGPAVAKWRDSVENPMPKGRGGYDLSKIAQWRSRQQAGSNLSDELKLADIRLKTAQAQQKELEMEVRRGELVELLEVERFEAMLIITFREMVMTVPETLAGSLPPEHKVFVLEESGRILRDALVMAQRQMENPDYLEGENDDSVEQ